MARCLRCEEKICSRENVFYPELGGFLCSYCEEDLDFIENREKEIQEIIKQNN